MAVASSRPKGSPLGALSAFGAKPRLGGLAAAGQDLGVMPGAVTAHVEAPEDRLGAAPFQCDARGLQLMTLGARVFPAFTAAFDQMADAGRLLQQEAAPQVVHIATLPALTQVWLSDPTTGAD